MVPFNLSFSFYSDMLYLDSKYTRKYWLLFEQTVLLSTNSPLQQGIQTQREGFLHWYAGGYDGESIKSEIKVSH